MTAARDVVFLLDCDNTLFDNDRLETDLGDHFVAAFGAASRDRYWELLEQLRSEVGYADYLGALQRARQQDVSDARLCKPEARRHAGAVVEHEYRALAECCGRWQLRSPRRAETRAQCRGGS